MIVNILCFGALLFTVVAQQRLRRCISLGGACGATNFHQRRLRRRHFSTGGTCGAIIIEFWYWGFSKNPSELVTSGPPPLLGFFQKTPVNFWNLPSPPKTPGAGVFYNNEPSHES